MDVASHLEARRITRTITEFVQKQLTEHLSTLSPLLRPRTVLGDYVAGSKQKIPGADVAQRRVIELYESIRRKPPFSLDLEMPTPLDVENAALISAPVVYNHAVATERGSKTVEVISPLKWTLAFAGLEPHRIPTISDRSPSALAELQRILLHTIVLHVTITSQPHLQAIFAALRFPLEEGRLEGAGELPLTQIVFPIGTGLPEDGVIVQATEIAGSDRFEEIAAIDDVEDLSDPLKEALRGIVASSGS